NPLFIVKLKPIKASDYSSPEKQQELLRRMPLSWRTFEPDYPDAYNYAFSMMHSGGGMNQYSGYSSPEADKLCEKALREEGPEREKALSALDRIYSEDAPYLLLFHSGAFRAFRKGITGTDSSNWLFRTNNYTDYYRLNKP
ncbi:MAG: hypothetical protein PHV33_14545, partial [Elusimicrobiales bacterium]|nr:hypothetical protein [Elusimicrobiales bacterium]